MKLIEILKHGVKWKILIISSIVFGCAIFMALFLQFQLFKEQQKITQNKIHYRDNKTISHLIVLSASHLRQLGDGIINIPDLSVAIQNKDIQTINEIFKPYWQTSNILQHIDLITFYDSRGDIISKWGDDTNNTMKSIATAAYNSAKTTPSYSVIDCENICTQYISIPITNSKNIVGGITIGTSLADLILGFKSISNIDIGIIINAKNKKTPSHDKRLINNWDSTIAAFTNIEYNAAMIKQLSKKYPNFTDITNNDEIIFPFNNEILRIHTNKMLGLNDKIIGHIITASSITQNISSTRIIMLESIIIGAISFAIAIAILTLLLSLLKIRDSRMDLIHMTLDKIKKHNKE